MRRLRSGQLLAGRGLEGDRYALGGGTWAKYAQVEKQLTLIDVDDVATVAREARVALGPRDTRRNLVTMGVVLPDLVGHWFAVGDALLFGAKRCPPCTHLERLTGARLIKAMASRGGINAGIIVGARIGVGDAVRPVTEEEAARRRAATGASRPVPRIT